MSEIGHNSDRATADELKSFIERIERLEEEKSNVGGDIKEVYAELKGRGYNPKVIRKIVAERRQDPNARREEAAIKQLYYDALGMFD